MEPLCAIEPGMKVSIAVDDISLPLPPMATPDLRQTMLEVVLDMCAANGVDDIHIIIANSLHRKMTEWEMKRMVGQKIFDEFYPDRYYNHDAEDEDGLVTLGHTRHNEPLRVNRRCFESDLTIYCNINLVPMDGVTNRSRSVCAITNRCVVITSRRPYAIHIRIWTRLRAS